MNVSEAGKLGGAARAANMTQEARTEAASKAAKAMWAKRKIEKREANKRPRHNDKPLPWVPVYNSANGPAKSKKARPYRGKSERREVIKARRMKKGAA